MVDIVDVGSITSVVDIAIDVVVVLRKCFQLEFSSAFLFFSDSMFKSPQSFVKEFENVYLNILDKLKIISHFKYLIH